MSMSKSNTGKFRRSIRPDHKNLHLALTISQTDVPNKSTGRVGSAHSYISYQDEGSRTPDMAVAQVAELSPRSAHVVNKKLPSIHLRRPTLTTSLSVDGDIYRRTSSYGSDCDNPIADDVQSVFSEREILSPTMGISISITTDNITEARSSYDPPKEDIIRQTREERNVNLRAKTAKKKRLTRSDRDKASRKSMVELRVTDEYMKFLDHEAARPRSMSLWTNPRIITLKSFTAEPRDQLPHVSPVPVYSEQSSRMSKASSTRASSMSSSSSNRSVRSRKHHKKCGGLFSLRKNRRYTKI